MIGAVGHYGLVHDVMKLTALRAPLSLCGSIFTGVLLEPIAAITCVWCVAEKLRPLAAFHTDRTMPP